MQRPDLFLYRLGKFALIPIALLLLAGAGYSAWSAKTWLDRAVEPPGSVVEMVRVQDGDDGSNLFAPLVRFQTGDGTTVEFQSSLRTNSPAYHGGQAVTVLYNPNEPRSAAIRGVLSLWFVPMILTVIGIVMLIIGTAVVVIGARVGRAFDRANAA